MKIIKLFFLLLLNVSLSCKDSEKTITELENVRTAIKKVFAPDKRVELFDIQFEFLNNQIILNGLMHLTIVQEFHRLLILQTIAC